MKTAREIKEKYASISKETCEGYQDEHILQAMEEYAEEVAKEFYDYAEDNYDHWLESTKVKFKEWFDVDRLKDDNPFQNDIIDAYDDNNERK